MGKKAFQFAPSRITLESCGDCPAVPHCRQIRTILSGQHISARYVKSGMDRILAHKG